MPIKLIGRTTDFSGKTLWEILGNLKDFGVGRLIKRNMFERYPEPSFIRILKVETLKPVEGEDRKVIAFVEKVFRGRIYPNAIMLEKTSYKADYRLIPKSEEKALWDEVAATKHETRILPETTSFPPLLKYLIEEEMKNKGQPVVEPKLKLCIKTGRDNFYRVQTTNETPTVKVNVKSQSSVYS